MQDITKLCADHLRAFSNNHGIKLKASHAHELVAAFFGYKSRAALLREKTYPINNLPQAGVVLLTPFTKIEERCKDLQDFPTAVIDNSSIYDELHHYLASADLMVPISWTHDYLKRQASILVDEHRRHSETLMNIYHLPSVDRVNVHITTEGLLITVLRYNNPSRFNENKVVERFDDLIITISLKRIAGHIGYSKPEISVRIALFNPERTSIRYESCKN